MMKISVSHHARQRMKQRGITFLEVEFVFKYPSSILRSFDNRITIKGIVNNRELSVVCIKKENYIKIITVM
jgi:uncharacterized DUF497 family protein